jgi:hypothetical protein
MWIQLIVMKYFRTLGWDSSNFHEISCELLHGCCSTAAVIASKLSGIREVHA